MTGSDGSEAMDAVRKLNEGQIEDLFAGRAPEGSGLDMLATALVSMRAARDEVAPDVAARHIATAAGAAAGRPEPAAVTPIRDPHRRRRAAAVFGAVLTTTFGKLATGVAAAGIAAGVAGAAGVLPDPVQSVLSEVSPVFPDPGDDRDGAVEVDGCPDAAEGAGSPCHEGGGDWPDRSRGFGRGDRPSTGPDDTVGPELGVDDPPPVPEVDSDSTVDPGDVFTEAPSDDGSDVDRGAEAGDEPTDAAETPTEQDAEQGFDAQDTTEGPTEGEADGTAGDDAADASETPAADGPEPDADAGLAGG